MQNFRNYYDILEVAPQASLDQIKQAYRRLARKYHPDLNPGDSTAEERFKVLGEAYEVLSDPERRSLYEKFSCFCMQKGFGRGRAKLSGGAGVGTASRSEAPPRNGGFSVGDVEFGEFRDFNTFVDQLLNRRGKASSEPPRPPSAEALLPVALASSPIAMPKSSAIASSPIAMASVPVADAAAPAALMAM